MDLLNSVFDTAGRLEPKPSFSMQGLINHMVLNSPINAWSEIFTHHLAAQMQPSMLEKHEGFARSYLNSTSLIENPTPEYTPFSPLFLDESSTQAGSPQKSLAAWLVSQGFATEAIKANTSLNTKQITHATHVSEESKTISSLESLAEVNQNSEDLELVKPVAKVLAESNQAQVELKPTQQISEQSRLVITNQILPEESDFKDYQLGKVASDPGILLKETEQFEAKAIGSEDLSSLAEANQNSEDLELVKPVAKVLAESNQAQVELKPTQQAKTKEPLASETKLQTEESFSKMEQERFEVNIEQPGLLVASDVWLNNDEDTDNPRLSDIQRIEHAQTEGLKQEASSQQDSGFLNFNFYQLPETDIWGLTGPGVRVPYAQDFWAQKSTNIVGLTTPVSASGRFDTFLSSVAGGQQNTMTGAGSEFGSGSERPTQMQQNQTAQLQSFAQQLIRQEQVIDQQRSIRESDIKLDLSRDAWSSTSEAQPKAERSATGPALASVQYPINHEKWAQAIGKRILFMANQQMQQAQISLNPEKLGPIQLRLQLDRDQLLSVSMTAQHALTREALEAAIPRLREMLSEAGIAFEDIKVSEEGLFGEGKAEQDSNNQRHLGANEEIKDEELKPELQSDNLIDFYV
ncbi:flagellar hook-length control protein FliK [Thiomicrospira microaerophila]|uniref:flagellar hook-length control protein FliK n=1 Tax=Thiomicrospira microaerophila TaxID=406020 RepID=UPI00200D4D20|nr:flagellar hook-length control protein FliK [Thiomicrospira microaerophila]UQB41684.1 flagellar hook-length control protein FliK [Thiomicrospira microaerophila]